ncbi:HAD-IIB family hydrolase [Terribacillus saccharophilus]|uniref:HAD family hydrolase n=1 Tax=Terribacillus saccharophilus TaxID=361277 RepID=A0A268A7H1_9BACI|nr:HAD-IIB family hydrolase [Terribacillus saccharophilus]PAD20029.1 HAD family hydrolase [Terribacillus saccharophilus]PAF17274.1 HAD family hydrolase [Terribacillus saccharophilus]PAF35471.1 HAD family hydrolase [Terribacillus saccharophilus]
MNFIFDLDGTICFKGSPVTMNIINALKELELNGHRVIFASARPIRDLLPVIDEHFHSTTLIGGNGSLISNNGKVIFSQAFSSFQLAAIKKLIEAHDATYLIDGEWNYAYTGNPAHPIKSNLDPNGLAEEVLLEDLGQVVKILILHSADQEKIATEAEKLGLRIHRHRGEDIVDISPPGIDKWSAIQECGIKENEYFAFGNDANDIEMFRHAKYAVMIGEHEELARYAHRAILLGEVCEQTIVECLKELSDEKNILALT